MLICLASVLSFLAVFKIGVFFSVFKGITAAISPIIVGACIAFTLNVLLSLYEKKLPQKFLAKLGRFKRLFCVVLTLFTVTALLAVFVLLIYPELKETVLTVASNLPGYATALIAYAATVTGKTESELFESVDINWESLAAKIRDFISGYGDKLISDTIGITGNVLLALLGACAAITLAELKHGIEKSAKPEKNELALAQLLTALTVIPFDDLAAVEYGKICAYLQKQGTPIGTMDMLIAASAHSMGMTLVTNNIREFERIPNLSLENWVENN